MPEYTTVDLAGAKDVRAIMTAYIRRYFADVLGPHLALLDQPGGLDTLSTLAQRGAFTPEQAK